MKIKMTSAKYETLKATCYGDITKTVAVTPEGDIYAIWANNYNGTEGCGIDKISEDGTAAPAFFMKNGTPHTFSRLSHAHIYLQLEAAEHGWLYIDDGFIWLMHSPRWTFEDIMERNMPDVSFEITDDEQAVSA